MRRRDAQSSALSFMDCICCGFGAVLLLFILTAKHQITQTNERSRQSVAALETLQAAIEEAEAEDKALDKAISALDPVPDMTQTSLAELAAERERLAEQIRSYEMELEAIDEMEVATPDPGSLNRPSADASYLAGLRLRGPRILILLESAGSMLAEDSATALRLMQSGQTKTAEKWVRAKAAVRTVLASIPKNAQVAVYHFNTDLESLYPGASPWFDPYDNAALISVLDRLDDLEAGGGSDLARAFNTIERLPAPASSILLISDGLPTAPAPGNGASEAERVQLMRRAMAVRPKSPLNVILLPFAGDPNAAGLFWQLSGQTKGVTLVPEEDWPPR